MEIAATSMSLAGAAATISLKVAALIIEIRDLSGDLELVKTELDSIEGILFLVAEQIYHLSEQGTVIATALTARLRTSVENCRVSVEATSDLATKYAKGGFRKIVGWLMVGKGELAQLHETLAARKNNLQISLNLLTMSMTAVVRIETTQILNSNTTIQHDVQAIMLAIQSLQHDQERMLELVETVRAVAAQQSDNPMLERFLGSLTTYTESVYERSIIAPDESPQPFPDSPRSSFSASDAETIAADQESELNSTAPIPQLAGPEELAPQRQTNAYLEQNERAVRGLSLGLEVDVGNVAGPLPSGRASLSSNNPYRHSSAIALETTHADEKQSTSSMSGEASAMNVPIRDMKASRSLPSLRTWDFRGGKQSDASTDEPQPKPKTSPSGTKGSETIAQGPDTQHQELAGANKTEEPQAEGRERKAAAHLAKSSQSTDWKLENAPKVLSDAIEVPSKAQTNQLGADEEQLGYENQRILDARIGCITEYTSPKWIAKLILAGANYKGRHWKPGENPLSRENHPGVPCINGFPLTNAVRVGNVGCVEVLLDAGAHLGGASCGHPNLFWAIYHSHAKIVSLLLAVGKKQPFLYWPESGGFSRWRRDDVCEKNCIQQTEYRYRTALTMALKVRQKMSGRTYDFFHPQSAAIVKELLEYGASINKRGVPSDINYRKKNETISYNSVRCIPADPFEGYTEHPFMLALHGRDPSMIELFNIDELILPQFYTGFVDKEMWPDERLTIPKLLILCIHHSARTPGNWVDRFTKSRLDMTGGCLIEVVRSLTPDPTSVLSELSPDDLVELAELFMNAGASPKTLYNVKYTGKRRFGAKEARNERLNALGLVNNVFVKDWPAARKARDKIRLILNKTEKEK